MSGSRRKGYYLVRSPWKAVAAGKAGVGWDCIDFSQCKDAAEAIRKIRNESGIGRRANQVRRFFAMQPGDCVVVPLAHSVAIGHVTGELQYNPEWRGWNAANQRPVAFFTTDDGSVKKFSRKGFTEAFQRRLRVRGMTINWLGEFAKELDDSIAEPDLRPWESKLTVFEEDTHGLFEQKLLKHLRDGGTNLETGSVGLELLVRELMDIDGYFAEVLSKREFPGGADADVSATRVDRITGKESKILIQAKHHVGNTDASGLKQLLAARQTYGEEGENIDLALVTTADIPGSVQEMAKENGIYTVDGQELVSWLCESLDSLSENAMRKLGICTVPVLAE